MLIVISSGGSRASFVHWKSISVCLSDSARASPTIKRQAEEYRRMDGLDRIRSPHQAVAGVHHVCTYCGHVHTKTSGRMEAELSTQWCIWMRTQIQSMDEAAAHWGQCRGQDGDAMIMGYHHSGRSG